MRMPSVHVARCCLGQAQAHGVSELSGRRGARSMQGVVRKEAFKHMCHVLCKHKRKVETPAMAPGLVFAGLDRLLT